METEKAIEELNIEFMYLKLQEKINENSKNNIMLKHCTIIGKDLISL